MRPKPFLERSLIGRILLFAKPFRKHIAIVFGYILAVTIVNAIIDIFLTRIATIIQYHSNEAS